MVDSRVATLEKSICEEAVYQEFDPYVATEYVCGFEMLCSKYKYEQNFLRDNINIETQEYLDAFNACYYTIKYDFKWLRSVKAHRSWVLTKVSTNDDIVKNKELFTAYVALINSDMDILNNFGRNCLIEKLSICDSSLLNKSYCTVVVENWIYELLKLSRTIGGKTDNLKNAISDE